MSESMHNTEMFSREELDVIEMALLDFGKRQEHGSVDSIAASQVLKKVSRVLNYAEKGNVRLSPM